MKKLLQLKLYSFLSTKWGFAVFLIGLFITFNSMLQLMAVLLQQQPLPPSMCGFVYTSQLRSLFSRLMRCTHCVVVSYDQPNQPTTFKHIASGSGLGKGFDSVHQRSRTVHSPHWCSLHMGKWLRWATHPRWVAASQAKAEAFERRGGGGV
jgi:hypothetical protein